MSKAGFYEIRSLKFSTIAAVNPAPKESDLTHGDAEEVVAAVIPSPSEDLLPDQELPALESDKRQRIWSLFLTGALLLLMAELFLSNSLASASDEGGKSVRLG